MNIKQKKLTIRLAVAIISFLSAVLIFYLDWFIFKNELVFTVVYIIPILLNTWFTGRVWGIALALLCIALWSFSYIYSLDPGTFVLKYFLVNFIGKIVTFIFLVIVLSLLKTNIERIREREKQYRILIEMAPEGIALCDSTGNVEYMNPALLNFFRPGDLKLLIHNNRWLNELINEEVHLNSLQGKWTERSLKDFDNQLKYAEILEIPFTQNHQKKKQIVFRDITERKTNEEKITEYAQKLEISNRELEQFAYVVAHDLKSPLTAVVQLAHFLVKTEDKKLSPEISELLGMISQRTDYMMHLIESILKYSKINAEKQFSKETIDLNTLVKELISNIFIPDHVKVQITQNLPVIIGNRIHFIQLFQNLIQNAIKYIDKPQGLIDIGYYSEDNFYRFFIKDNGPGIQQSDFKKIFELFKRLENTHNKSGTGVGLAIVKKIIEKYRGEIWVESDVKVGSVFYFTLPKNSI